MNGRAEMKTKQTILFGVLALLGGIIGGIISDGLPEFAIAKSGFEEVIRATKFELVDRRGNKKAYLTTEGSSAVLHIGEDVDHPFFSVKRSNSGITMVMTNGLSVESNDVTLSLNDDGARIDFQGKVFGHKHKARKIQMGIDSNGEPMFQLFDDFNKPRLEIGKTELKNTKTGSTEIRSTGSIVIYDEKGKVIYRVP
jgi:hypothetical protein